MYDWILLCYFSISRREKYHPAELVYFIARQGKRIVSAAVAIGMQWHWKLQKEVTCGFI
jgi:hypothetical protein